MARYRVETDQGNFEVETEEAPSPTLSDFAKEHINPTSFPVINKLNELGSQVKDAAVGSFDNLTKGTLPKLPVALTLPAEAMRGRLQTLGEDTIKAAPFTPQELAIAVGGELAPGAMLPNGAAIAPKYGRALMEDVVPSSAKQIRRSVQTGRETAADIVANKPELGMSRADILKNSSNGIDELENQIQAKIKDASTSKINSNLSANAPNTIDRSVFEKVFDDAIDEAKSIPTAGKDVRALTKLKNEYLTNAPESATIDYWNGLKRKLYKRLGDDAYLKDVTSTQKNIEKRLASSIAKEIGDRVDGIKGLNREQGKLIEVRDSIINSSPHEVRSLRPWDPLLERAGIVGGRILSKKRTPELSPINFPIIRNANENR